MGRNSIFLSNVRGRLKAEKSPNLKQVSDFLRQIANLSEKQFSYTSPILDVSFGRYRLNAVFSSLSRKANEKPTLFLCASLPKNAESIATRLFSRAIAVRFCCNC